MPCVALHSPPRRHPMSFRNREKVYKAEVAQYEVEKRNQEARDEYAAEQEHM